MSADKIPTETSHEKLLNHEPEGTTRRDFLNLTACALGAVGAGAAILPFINSMNPAADTLALASIDIELNTIPAGQTKTFIWRGKPVFVRHRLPDEIQNAQKASIKELPDPQTDQERFKIDPKWLVVVGVCTHLGCIPGERKNMAPNEGGWLCACHGSFYDTSGRIVRGPAPKNLEVPPYQLLNNGSLLRIG